jgi:hypothetical protein
MTHLQNTAASNERSGSTRNDGGEERTPKEPLAPDFGAMDDRSVRAWTEAMSVAPLGDGRYSVEGQSDETYVVDLPESGCTCPDHTIRGERCKHLRRVVIEVNRGRVAPPGRVRGICEACGREAFLPEGGPPLCDTCRLDPGDFATDRETGDTVVVARVTGARADEVTVGSRGRTVADYPTNEGYPSDDLVVEVVYPFSRSGVSFADLPRYSFPFSRLARREESLVGPFDRYGPRG